MGRNSTSDPSVQPDVPPVLILVSLAEDFWGELDFFPLFDGALSCVTSLRGRLSGNLLFISSSVPLIQSQGHCITLWTLAANKVAYQSSALMNGLQCKNRHKDTQSECKCSPATVALTLNNSPSALSAHMAAPARD